jgi:RimJ/RimL family protein N-acetyltransferase
VPIPTLRTERLLLRPFQQDDAPVVQALAGVPEVALTTQNIPYPYEDGIAEQWIATHRESWEDGTFLTLAVTCPAEGLVGAVGLDIDAWNRRAELGYWIGRPFWGRGYATEAAAAVMELGFDLLDLNRIEARHMTRNPASGRVMQKVGMEFEGVHRQSLLIRGAFEDIAVHAALQSDDRPAWPGNTS